MLIGTNLKYPPDGSGWIFKARSRMDAAQPIPAPSIRFDGVGSNTKPMVKIKKHPGLRSSVVSARRVIQPKDICVLAGTYLIRYGTRTLLPALALTLTMIAGNKAMGGGRTALPFTPMIVALLLVTTGFALKVLPVLFSRKRLIVAEARGFDQLEIYRKARLPVLLGELENRVFRHESALKAGPAEREAEERLIHARREEIASLLDRLAPETLEWLGARKGSDLVAPLVRHRPLSRGIEASRSGFLITAYAGLASPLSETASRAATGYDLSLLADYLDGAPFHTSDTKLDEQFHGHPLIKAAQKDVKAGKRKLPGYLRGSVFTRRSDLLHRCALVYDSMEEKVWRAGICREVMVQSGRAFAEIDAAYPGALITASSFLRPGDAGNEYHRRFPGLPEALRDQGKRVLQRVLGDNRTDAFTMVDRMKIHSLVRAFALRLAYDPEYVTGWIQPGFLSDVEEILSGSSPAGASVPDRFHRYREEIRADQEALDSLVSLPDRDPSDRRALRCAWHVNLFDFRERRASAIDEILAERETISDRLLAVRFHHALALIDRQEYRHHVDVIAFAGEES